MSEGSFATTHKKCWDVYRASGSTINLANTWEHRLSQARSPFQGVGGLLGKWKSWTTGLMFFSVEVWKFGEMFVEEWLAGHGGWDFWPGVHPVVLLLDVMDVWFGVHLHCAFYSSFCRLCSCMDCVSKVYATFPQKERHQRHLKSQTKAAKTQHSQRWLFLHIFAIWYLASVHAQNTTIYRVRCLLSVWYWIGVSFLFHARVFTEWYSS